MGVDTMLQDGLEKRRGEYMGRLAMLSRKREEHRRAIEDIDNDIVILEASRAEINRVLGDVAAQAQALVAEKPTESERSTTDAPNNT